MKINQPAIGPQHSRRRFLQLGILAGGGLALPGLGATTNLHGQRILILGAGLSGLVAGYELRRAGHKVTILEATLRPGGRVRTIREPFSDGLFAEAGAGRIPATHKLTLDYIKHFGLRDQDVRVTYEKAGEKRTLTADRLICGAPFPALRHVQFKPALSAGKTGAIAELPYGSVTRVYLQSRRRFWLDSGCNGFANSLDQPMEIWNPSHDQPGQRGVQLAYLYEDLARHVAAMPGIERITYFLDIMEKVFPGARENFEGGASFCWEEQPYQRGAYAVYTKGAYDSYGPHVATREGRIHFCGEHTSPWPAWMQGALYSGLRAAKEAVA